MIQKMSAEEVLATAHGIMAREGRVTGVALGRALGVAQSTASRWIDGFRQDRQWPFPAVKPGDHGPQASRRRQALSTVDTHLCPSPPRPPRRPRGPRLTLSEWRRRSWPAIFGVPFVPCAPPPPVTAPCPVVGWAETDLEEMDGSRCDV
jgi:hypothetical protein